MIKIQKYQRRTEFRKLCDLMRLHLNQIQKQQHLTHGLATFLRNVSFLQNKSRVYIIWKNTCFLEILWNLHFYLRVKLSSAESLAMMQETRLHQLDTAITMELWQEAYR